MGHSELLRFVALVLNDLALKYFVTGSTATIFYGEPRLTNDIDIVVDIPESVIPEFCSRFPSPKYYVSETAALDAVRRHAQFNIIDSDSGLKIDIIVPEVSAFNTSRFARSRQVPAVADLAVSFASPEDTILKKMEYYRDGGSEKHIRDIAGVLKAGAGQIDLAYISKWSAELGLEEIWTTIQGRTT
jgi:hypothetical protein